MSLYYTRCTQCRTTFRITSQQLELRDGRARCGQCRTVFNALSSLVALKEGHASVPVGMEEIHRATMTLRDPAPEPDSAFTAIPRPLALDTDVAALTSPSLRSSTRSGSLPEERPFAAEDASEERTRRKKKRRKSQPSLLSLVLNPAEKPTIWQRLNLPPWSRPLFYLISLPGLAVLLAAQATFFLHDELASAYPKLTPALSQGCRLLQCEIKPLKNLNALTIEASDLQSDPNDAQQLLLAVTLRNRSDRPVAYPSLSLDLVDAQDRLLARRIFPPETYLIRAADINTGAPAARDLVLRLLLRSSLAASGYRLSLVYQ